jgi:hypothetical protein
MSVRRIAVAAMLCAVAACGEDSLETTAPKGSTYLRFINSVYQEEAPLVVPQVVIGSTTYDTTYTIYTAIPIDILIDSSNATPSVIGLAPNSIAPGTIGPEPLVSADARYRPTSVGVHSFVARVNGGATPGPSFFTTPSGTQYLPQLFLTNTTYCTLFLAGVNPVQPATGYTLAPSDLFSPNNNFPSRIDDPFTPSTVVRNGVKTLQARLQISNFAPFVGTLGHSDYLHAYVTPGTGVPDLTNLVPFFLYIGFQSQSDYTDVKPGTYRVTFALLDGSVVYSDVLTLNAGEVHSIVLQNDMQTYTVANATITTNAGTSSESVSTSTVVPTATYKLTDITDNQFTL